MKEPSLASVVRWLAVGIGLMYVTLTLAAAAMAAPPMKPGFLLPNLHRAAAPLAQALPGAGLWPRVMDMHGTIGGEFSTPLVGVLLLGMASLGALSLAKRRRDQLRKDAATAHDEAICEEVRQGKRRP